MSLYNLLFGVNPHAPMLLSFLGITANDVPRFRDCYAQDGKIAIHTRTGGGNRDFYEHPDRCRDNYPEYFTGTDDPAGPWNCDLRSLPGFAYDEDDDSDSTYATFYYEPSEDVAKLVRQLGALNASSPAERWQKLFADMDAGRDNPQVARALEVGKPIIEQITAALNAPPEKAEQP